MLKGNKMLALKTLYPERRQTKIGDHSAVIYPPKLRNMQDVATITGELMGMLANANAVAYTAFCAKHSELICRVLQSQTTLKKKHIADLSADEAVQWVAAVVFENQAVFATALSGLIASLPDGAKSTSD